MQDLYLDTSAPRLGAALCVGASHTLQMSQLDSTNKSRLTLARLRAPHLGEHAAAQSSTRNTARQHGTPNNTISFEIANCLRRRGNQDQREKQQAINHAQREEEGVWARRTAVERRTHACAHSLTKPASAPTPSTHSLHSN